MDRTGDVIGWMGRGGRRGGSGASEPALSGALSLLAPDISSSDSDPSVGDCRFAGGGGGGARASFLISTIQTEESDQKRLTYYSLPRHEAAVVSRQVQEEGARSNGFE